MQSSTQKDVFYKVQKNGNTFSCNCKNYHPIKICTHVYIASRYISVHPIKGISKKRKAEATETINKLQKVTQAIEINNEVPNYQNKFVTTNFKTSQEYEADLSKTQKYSFPVTSLNYNYASVSTDSQVIPFSQPVVEADLPDINEPEEFYPAITVEEFQKHGLEAIEMIKDVMGYASENYTDKILLNLGNQFREFTSNMRKNLSNNPKTAKQRRW